MAAVALGSGHSASAASFPDHPIKLIAAFSPGGPTDILARILATGLGKVLGQSVIVDNKAGGGGLIGAQAAAKAEPDGYTLLFAGDGQLTVLPLIFRKSGYDADRSFVPIRMVAGQDNVLVASKNSGIASVESLVARAKAKPATVSYGSAGNGTPSQLIGALFEKSTGTRLLHVPYRGSGPAMADLLGGQTDLMFIGMPVALQQAKGEKLSLLATTGNARSPHTPQVPTFKELGVAGLGDETGVWWAVMAPHGVPASVKVRLEHAVETALADPDVKKALNAAGVDVMNSDAAAVEARIRKDRARWAGLINSGTLVSE